MAKKRKAASGPTQQKPKPEEDSDPTLRRIFVHGLGPDTTTDQLREAFKSYGDIKKCKITKDKATGRAKGFGFFLFKTRAAAIKALETPQKKIRDRTVLCQLACEGPPGKSEEDNDSDPTSRKIFVHRLGKDVTSDQLIRAFRPYGEIEECELMTDKATGFAFVLFKTRAAAFKAVKYPWKNVGDCVALCELASVDSTVAEASEFPAERKIYVTNVGPNVDGDKLRDFFAKFGEIEEGPLGFDLVSNKSKGFAIFVYKTIEGCKKALKKSMKRFDGCHLVCRKIVENISSKKGRNHDSKKNEVGQMCVGDDDYGMGVSSMVWGPSLNPGGLLMAQNQGNLMMTSVMNQSGLDYIGVNYGIETIMSRDKRSSPVCRSNSWRLGTGQVYSTESASINEPTHRYRTHHRNYTHLESQISTSICNPCDLRHTNIQGKCPDVGKHQPVTISPRVVGSYSSQSTFQGLGPCQSAEIGRSLVGGLAGNQMMAASGLSANYRLNSNIPSVVKSYSSRAALQGLGTYQSAQMGQSLVGGLAGNPMVAASGLSENYRMNSNIPSVVGSYSSQAALQGLGSYQSAEMGRQSSYFGGMAAGRAVGATRAQSGDGSFGTTFPSYFCR